MLLQTEEIAILKIALKYIKKINSTIKNSNIKIGTIIGRYYAMDRDSKNGIELKQLMSY